MSSSPVPLRSEGTPDPTTEAGIDIGQRWHDGTMHRCFEVVATYRDNPINPTFRVRWETHTGRHAYHSTLTLAYFKGYCVRSDS